MVTPVTLEELRKKIDGLQEQLEEPLTALEKLSFIRQEVEPVAGLFPELRRLFIGF